ncbi:MAG: 4'-phosphopantetheinyl transferase superfamily protein [Lachnospiraceae bacterium]|nr:4'-phosphopantetheinyl transferase superfamily protein [Lachnospiraceae bacterium]
MIYILSMKELDKEKRKEAQRRLFSYGVFQKAWEKYGICEVTREMLPTEDCGVEILRGEHGKPYVKDNPWYFNTSHSGEYLVMVFDTIPVGIDVQELRPVRKPELIAKRFSEKEQEYIASGGEDALYRVWCRKEAYAKCVGRGLTDEILQMDSLDVPEGYEMTESMVAAWYRMCVCRRREK